VEGFFGGVSLCARRKNTRPISVTYWQKKCCAFKVFFLLQGVFGKHTHEIVHWACLGKGGFETEPRAPDQQCGQTPTASKRLAFFLLSLGPTKRLRNRHFPQLIARQSVGVLFFPKVCFDK
jgi:hypothetical protein